MVNLNDNVEVKESENNQERAMDNKDENKRLEESDSDDDIGPMPPKIEAKPNLKKRRVLQHEQIYLDQLPIGSMYEKSFMHKDTLTLVKVSKNDFIITASIDGHLKFWKKTSDSIEFVKHYKAHIGMILGLSISNNGQLLASISDDKSIKIFDIINFDMINIIKLDYIPGCVSFVYHGSNALGLVACSDEATGIIHLYDSRGSGQPLHSVNIHNSTVTSIVYSHTFNTVISSDISGSLEFWTPLPPFELDDSLSFQYKSQTDLYHFKKNKSFISNMEVSEDGLKLVTMSSTSDRKIRIFNIKDGKLLKVFDENLDVYNELQQVGSDKYKLDAMEFGRRLVVEREWVNSIQAKHANAIFDSTGNFLFYGSLLGIKLINLKTNQVSHLLGKSEPLRFLNLALYQPKPNQNLSIQMVASNNPLLQENDIKDPILICSAFKRNRFYLFSRREPITGEDKVDRDVFNEKPTRDERALASSSLNKSNKIMGTKAILHTTLGDIHLTLYPQHAPLAVENFCTHSTNNYFDNVVFHRIIKQFMIQTGDPLGDGTGGDSIFGSQFKDELTPSLNFNLPYKLAMANAGPNTNGSQFFITTAQCNWLDQKHTIFGHVDKGFDIIKEIENVKTDHLDRPLEDILIVSIEIVN